MKPILPDLHTGVYRHYKGYLYEVKGYAHNSSACDEDGDPRIAVHYEGMELTEAHEGPRTAFRDLYTVPIDDPVGRRQFGQDGFFDIICANPACLARGEVVHMDEDDNCYTCGQKAFIQQRFVYLGPEFRREMLVRP